MISASMLGLAAESGAPLADRNPSPPEVRSAKVPPLLDVDSGSPATSGRTAVQFDDWLEMSHAIAMPADIDGLLGRKVRLDQVFDELNRQLSALALRVTRNAVTSEYAVTAAAQLLFNDPRLKGNVPSRKLAAMLGFNQDKKFAEAELDDQVSKVLDALAEDKSRPH